MDFTKTDKAKAYAIALPNDISAERFEVVEDAKPLWSNEHQAPFTCKYCGMPSWIDPSDQSPPPDYCHEIDHGTEEDRSDYRE